MNEQKRTVADEVGDDEEIQKIKEEFHDEPDTVKLRANRVPKYVSDDLKDEADEKFAGDYGMALTFWHKRKEDVENLHTVINDLTARIARLERRIEEINKDEVEDPNEDGLETLNG